MGKRIRDYVKYSINELERYVKTPTSCITKVNTPFHLNFPPYGLNNFRQTLLDIIAEKKIGLYDAKLKGIILDLRHIKVMGDVAALRSDDPAMHINLQADCYVFQPHVGAIIQGLVKHISDRQIGVIIFRVFSVSIRLHGHEQRRVQLNTEIEFRIKQFDLGNAMPFIEGELISGHDEANESFTTPKNKSIKFEAKTETCSSGYNSDGSQSKSRTFKEPKSKIETPRSKRDRNTTSPDIFASTSDLDEAHDVKPKIKTEQHSQTPTKSQKKKKIQEERQSSVSDSDESVLQPGQRISLKPLPTTAKVVLTPSQENKSKRKQNVLEESSDAETKIRIKEEILSQSNRFEQSTVKFDEEVAETPVKRKKAKKSYVKSEPLDEEVIPPTLPHATDEVLVKKDKHTPRKDSSLNANSDRIELAEDNSIRSRLRKRKRIDSTSDTTPKSSKKRKITPDDVTTIIHLDSDFEMTTTIAASKNREKKKKSKKTVRDSELPEDVSNGQLDVTDNTIVDYLDSFTHKKDKKKRMKSKE